MKELLEQFLAETRELAQRATDDLLLLEAQPDNGAVIDGLFRTFHTLKGSADIIGLPPMSLVMHVGEDVVSAIRDGALPCSPAFVDQALKLIDLVNDWADALEAHGVLPADADQVAASTASSLRTVFPSEQEAKAGSSVSVTEDDAPDWAEAMLAVYCQGHDLPGDRDLVAIAYDPLPNAYFSGDDPLDFFRRLAGLLALDVAPQRPWPAATELDPFECNFSIRALALQSKEEALAHFRSVGDQVRIYSLKSPKGEKTDLIAAVLGEQRRLLLVDAAPDALLGRIGSAARTAANALRSAGNQLGADAVEKAGVQALVVRNAGLLAEAIETVMGGGSAQAPVPLVPPLVAQGDRMLRIEAAKVDIIADLAGELVIARNGFAHLVRHAEAGVDLADLTHSLRRQYATFDRLTAAMHSAAMQLRMLPLKQVFRRFPRLVREIDQELGKDVELKLVGEEVEADKAVIEKLYEPLLHIVRNALDHGCETPAERRTAGKSARPQLTLRALRDGNGVRVEIEDDGRGVDPEVIRRIAVARGLLDEEAAAQLSSEEALQFLFMPGFSTASQVSKLSGRGVGMDAVRAGIEELGGRISLSSELGLGTKVCLHLPGSLLMTGIMTVVVGEEQFGIPLDVIVESIRAAHARIVPIRQGRAIVLRDRTVPIIRLSDRLSLPQTPPGRDAHIVVVSTDSGVLGLEVDAFGSRMETMMKPLDGLLAGMENYVGTTLLGDGRVLLVLDVNEVLR